MRLVLGLTAALAVAAFVQADTKADLQKRYNELAVAVKKKDVTTCLGMLSADYTDVDPTGKKQTRKEFEKMVREQFKAPITVETFVIKVNKVTPKGSDFIAENSTKMTLTFMNPQTKKKSTVEQSSTAKDVWTKSGSRWLLKQSTTLTQKRTLDGKSIGG